MSDEILKRSATVNWFEHVEKGGTPAVFRQRTGGRASPLPGDGIFGEVEVDGVMLCCTVLGANAEGVKPEQFELALRAMLAALNESCGVEQPKGVYVVPDGPMN